jgi:hypothetical protein
VVLRACGVEAAPHARQMRRMHTNFEEAQRSLAALERHFEYNKTLLATLPAGRAAAPSRVRGRGSQAWVGTLNADA